MNVVRQFQFQLLNRVKPPTCYEFSLDHLEGRFSNRIVIGAAFHAQGTADLKAFQEFIYQNIVKLAAAICIKDLDFKQVSSYGRKSFVNQLGDFMSSCAVSDDFSGSQIKQNADVRSLGSNPYIRQIFDYTGSREPVAEFSLEEVCNGGFIHPGCVNTVLLARVGGYQTPLLHNLTDLSPGYDPALAQQDSLEFPLAVYTTVLVIRDLYGFF